jgi:hypothetical protein
MRAAWVSGFFGRPQPSSTGLIDLVLPGTGHNRVHRRRAPAILDTSIGKLTEKMLLDVFRHAKKMARATASRTAKV